MADINVERKAGLPLLPILLGVLLLAAIAYFFISRGGGDDASDGTGTPTTQQTTP